MNEDEKLSPPIHTALYIVMCDVNHISISELHFDAFVWRETLYPCWELELGFQATQSPLRVWVNWARLSCVLNMTKNYCVLFPLVGEWNFDAMGERRKMCRKISCYPHRHLHLCRWNSRRSFHWSSPFTWRFSYGNSAGCELCMNAFKKDVLCWDVLFISWFYDRKFHVTWNNPKNERR